MDQSNMQIDFDAEKFENDFKDINKSLEEAHEKIKDFEITFKNSNEVNKNVVQEKKQLEEQNLRLRKDINELRPTLNILEKLDDEENKDSLLLQELKSKLKLAKFSSMDDEEKKNSSAKLNFQDFKKNFIDENKKIMEWHMTKGNDYIFICKVKADLDLLISIYFQINI